MARIARTQCTQSVSITVTPTHTLIHTHTHTYAEATKTTHKRGRNKLWETQQPTPQAAGRSCLSVQQLAQLAALINIAYFSA